MKGDIATARVEAEGEISPTGRAAVEIDPARVVLDSTGQVLRSFVVRLPGGLIADDLKEPRIWRRVQLSRNAFRKFDRLFCIDFDESWVAECIVENADTNKAVLAIPRLTRFSKRFEKLFEDELYRSKFVGHGYVVERKSDGHIMCEPVASAAHAERLLMQLYPRPAA